MRAQGVRSRRWGEGSALPSLLDISYSLSGSLTLAHSPLRIIRIPLAYTEELGD
jgi:hypothetical protein